MLKNKHAREMGCCHNQPPRPKSAPSTPRGDVLYNAVMKSRVPWRVKLERASAPKNPHLTEAPPQWFGGKVGGKMVIPSALELDEMIRQIPDGQTVNIKDLRAEYAAKHGADITCPMTSGIFLRIIAENAEEERANGRTDVTPYWKVVADNGKMPPKIQTVYDLHH